MNDDQLVNVCSDEDYKRVFGNTVETAPLGWELFNRLLVEEPVFQDMKATVEASPYHREENVLVHTMMVCDWYCQHVSELKDWFFLGLFACLLHDIAKPCCRVQKENEERGVYYSFDKHDVVGASMVDEMLGRYGVSDFDTYRISWMVEHHQIFWATKKVEQKYEMYRTLITRDFYDPFKYMMLADDQGRICDKRTVDAEKYFQDFCKLFEPHWK